jgi:transcriptional regulator with GAF, ATPase, and Fis domain
LSELADFCLNAGEFATAADYYRRIIEIADRDGLGELKSLTLSRLARCLRGLGEFAQALEVLEEAETGLRQDGHDSELAAVLNDKAWIFVQKDQYDRAARECKRALRIVQDEDRFREMAVALSALGTIALRQGHWEAARDFYEDSLSIYRRINDREGMGKSFNNLGLIWKNQGVWDRAIRYQTKAVQIAEAQGNSLQRGIRLNNLGITLFKKGDWEGAHRAWTEGLRVLEGIGNRSFSSQVYLNLANHCRVLRQWGEGEGYARRALDLARESGNRRGEILAHEFLGRLAYGRGDLGEAEQRYQDALRGAEEIAPQGDLVAETLTWQAELYLAQGFPALALEAARRALGISRQLTDPYQEAVALRFLGRAQADLGERDRAQESLLSSIDRLRRIHEPYEMALSLLALARHTLRSNGDLIRCGEMYREAEAAFEALGAHHEEAVCLREAAEVEVLRERPADAQTRLDRAARIFESLGEDEELDETWKVRLSVDRALASSSASHANDLSTFNHIVESILSLPHPGARLERILETLATRTEAAFGVALESPRPGGWEPVATLGPVGEREQALQRARAVIAAVADERAPFVSTQPGKDRRMAPLLAETGETPAAVLAVPLLSEDLLLGGLYVEVRDVERPITPRDVDLAVALGHVAEKAMLDHRADRMRAENLQLREELGLKRKFAGVITQNAEMLHILKDLDRLASTDATMLVTGETGTGKELLAHTIHEIGHRSEKPFVTLSCADLSRDVLESELFGHVRGAFTDAKTDRVGLFERADGGIVFIDEVDKTTRSFQERLLRVVDKKEIKPVGDTRWKTVDVQIICATNADLLERVERGEFLKDLYYRLRVISIALPPLRARREDIPLLAQHFLEMWSDRCAKRLRGFTPEAMRLLIEHDWPGNVRDLEHEIQRVVMLAPEGTQIAPDRFSEELLSARARSAGAVGRKGGRPLAQVLEDVERDLVREALLAYGGNRSQAARKLGLSRKGLLNKIKRYALADVGRDSQGENQVLTEPEDQA